MSLLLRDGPCHSWAVKGGGCWKPVGFEETREDSTGRRLLLVPQDHRLISPLCVSGRYPYSRDRFSSQLLHRHMLISFGDRPMSLVDSERWWMLEAGRIRRDSRGFYWSTVAPRTSRSPAHFTALRERTVSHVTTAGTVLVHNCYTGIGDRPNLHIRCFRWESLYLLVTTLLPISSPNENIGGEG